MSPGLSVATVESSSTFFDFDALEEAIEALSEATSDGISDADSEASDAVSEVWPGDVVHCEDSDDSEDSEDGVLDELEPAKDGVDSCEEDVRAWEVVISRAVVRGTPSLAAPVVGICTQRELIFEDHDPAHPDWVRLVMRRGFVLKDGRKRDPTLGMLLKPYVLDGVPDDCQPRVLRRMRDAWVEAQRQSNYLRPLSIRRLRRAGDSALATALRAGAFEPEAFEAVFDREVRMLLSEGEGAAAKAAPQGEERQGAAVVSPGNIIGHNTGAVGRKPWDYAASSLPDGRVTMAHVRTLLEGMRRRSLPSGVDAATIISQATSICSDQPSLVELRVPTTGTLHVVGDLHGQYWDLMHILEMFGDPSPTNQYLFNGDFVDRGQFSVEVSIALLALKVAAPNCVHLNRGNHEAIRMNIIYGFMAEAQHKYNAEVFRLFCQAFASLPLAAVVNGSIFVVHGGLSSQDGVLLDRIASVCRMREPDEKAEELMIDLLWSDPMEKLGRDRSPRGGGVLFGPDVTRDFCATNGLECIIRSHEMKQQGFEWHHNRQCLTVFSAPNYCGICGNSGAVVNVTPRRGARRLTAADLEVRTFEATPHPDERGTIPGLF